MNLDLAINTKYPNDLGKALKYFSDSTKPEGDAAIFIAKEFESVPFKVWAMMMIDFGFIDRMSVIKMKKLEYSFVHCADQIVKYQMYRRRFVYYWLFQTGTLSLCMGDRWPEVVKAMSLPFVFLGSYSLWRISNILNKWEPKIASILFLGAGAALLSTLKVL